MTDAPRLNALAEAAHRLHAGSASGRDRRLLGGVGLEPLTGGSNNPLYRFDLDGRALCLKLPVDDRRRAEREWRALTLLSRRGKPTVPEPVWRSERPERPAIVMTYADGASLGSDPLAPPQLDALAGALTDVYAITPDAVAESFPDVVTPAPVMVTRVHRTWAELQATTDPEVAADRHDLFVAWRRWYSGPEPQRLIAPTARAFGRGDPSLANLLWDGTRLTLLDFEYSGWTDPAFELADLVEHTQSRATPDHTWDQLIERFDLDPAARERHHAARRLMCLFWTARSWHHQGRFTLQAARTRHLFADLLNPRPGR